MSQIELNDYRMNVDVCPALLPLDTVFIHGNLASNTWWLPALGLWRAEAKPGLEGRMIAAEWRGCGQSDAPTTEAELHPSALADDYIALCEKLNVKKACLVGHSTGGIIALYAMLKAPHLFDNAVLLDPVGGTGVQFGPEMYDAFTKMSRDRSTCEAVMSGTIHGMHADALAGPLFQKIVDDAFQIAKINWHGVPRALHNTNITSELAKIRNRILIVHGELDPLIPVESSKALAESLPDARLDIVQNQGHSLNVENPALFVKKVNEFLFQRP